MGHTREASEPIGPYPRVRIEGGGRTVDARAGGVLLVGTVRKAGLDTVLHLARSAGHDCPHSVGMVITGAIHTATNRSSTGR